MKGSVWTRKGSRTRIRACLPVPLPETELALIPSSNQPDPTQPNTGSSRTCFRRSLKGVGGRGAERSLEATEPEQGPASRALRQTRFGGLRGKEWDCLGDRFSESRPVPSDPERSRRPSVLQGLAYPQAGGLRGPPAARLPERVERAVGASRGAGAAGAQGVGPRGPGEERDRWAAGCWEGRAPAAATAAAAAAVRPGRAAKSARRELEVCVAQLSHVSVPAGSGSRGPGGGLERRFRWLPRQCRSVGRSVVPAAALSKSPRTWTRAARCRSSPSSARGKHSFAPQKPPPPGLPRPALSPFNPLQGPGGRCPGAQEWARPEGGPSAPAWALARSLSGSPRCLRRWRS